MTLSYRYRWYYVLGLLCGTCWLSIATLLQPGLKRLAALHDACERFQQRALVRPASHGQSAPVHVVPALHAVLQALLLSIHQCGLQVKSMRVEEGMLDHQSVHVIRLTLSGPTSGGVHFLSRILQVNPDWEVTELFCHMSNADLLQVQLTLCIAPEGDTVQRLSQGPMNAMRGALNPHIFCFAKELPQFVRHDALPLMASLASMRLVGFFKNTTDRAGLIALQSGATFIVHLHDHIGREDGVVIAIKRHRVVVALGKQQQVIHDATMA